MNTNEYMDHTLSVLLVEDDRAACEVIENYVDKCDGITLAGITGNSFEALEMVRQYLPDAVILDLELHHGGGNGLSFLQSLSGLSIGYQPYILVTTNNSSSITYETARKFGADFIMSKHEKDYSGKKVIDFLLMIQETLLANRSLQQQNSAANASPEEKQRKLTQRIYRELDLVGISRKNVGYQYLADAILITYNKPEANLPAVIAEKYRKSDSSVERAMQNAINRAWRTFPVEELEAHYTAKTHSCRGVPTIMEFVFYYAGLLKTEIKNF